MYGSASQNDSDPLHGFVEVSNGQRLCIGGPTHKEYNDVLRPSCGGVCVCVCVRVCVCKFVCVHVCACPQACVHTCISMNVQYIIIMCIYMNVYTCILYLCLCAYEWCVQHQLEPPASLVAKPLAHMSKQEPKFPCRHTSVGGIQTLCMCTHGSNVFFTGPS